MVEIHSEKGNCRTTSGAISRKGFITNSRSCISG